MIQTTQFLIYAIVAFLVCCPIPFFARRYGKFLPADAGTAFMLSFHKPKFAKSDKSYLISKRRRLWIKLALAGFFWGVMGSVSILLLLYFKLSLTLFVMLWLCSLMACVDEKLHILPDVLTVPLLILGFCAAAFSLQTIPPTQSALGALFGYALPTITAAIMTPIYPRSLGGGDYKMMAGLGAWLGVSGLSVAILASVIFFGIIAIIRQQRQGPYGLSLLLGAICALTLQEIPFFKFLFFF